MKVAKLGINTYYASCNHLMQTSMMKQNYTLALPLFLSLLLPCFMDAQAFWSEDFSNGLPDSWSTEDASGQSVDWVHCANSADCLPVEPATFCNRAAISNFYAPSAENGFMMLRSINVSEPHISRLTSAEIDCSAQDQVFVQFQTSIGSCNDPAATAARLIVVADGQSTIYYPFPALTDNSPQRAPLRYLAGQRSYTATFDISEAAAGQADVQLIWEWEARNESAWLVDDVILSNTNPAAPDRTVYFEPFSFGSNGWTSVPLEDSELDSNWHWVPGGDVSSALSVIQNGTFPPQSFIHSATASDGAMAFNADFYTTQGDDFAPPINYLCELVSPVIDLSETQQPLALQLTHLASLSNIAPGAPSTEEGFRFILSYAYSTDGGQSWSEPYPVSPYLTSVTGANFRRLPPHLRTEYLPLYNAEGSDNFRLKFTWAGDYFYWVIDDVAIVERPVVDLRTNRNFYARTPNAITPISQLTDVPLLADVENIGATEVANAQQTFAVKDNNGGATLYESEQAITDLEVDSLFENQLFPQLLPAATFQNTGDYTATYGLAGLGNVERPEDNQQSWPIQLSDTLFAKENGFTRDVAPIGGTDYRYGNCFYVPNGEGYFARTISFRAYDTDRIVEANPNAFVALFLYEWDGDTNQNGLADAEELEEVAFNFHQFTGNEGLQPIVNPVNMDNVGVPLKDDTYYLAIVQYSELNGPPMFMLVSDTIDYQATYLAHEEAGLRPRYGAMLQVGTGQTFSFDPIGFGLNIVPTVRLSIGTSPILNDRQQLLPEQSLSVSPNPAVDEVQVHIDLPADYQPRQLRLYSLQGQMLKNWALSDLDTVHSFSVADLPAGIYVVQLSTGSGSRSVKLVVGG
jgi:hypothetical protein